MEKLAELVRTQLGIQDAISSDRINEPIPQEAARVTPDTLASPLQPHRVTRSTMLISRPGHPVVGTATLELADTPLHEQIHEFASVALAAGCKQVQLLPIFLLPGVHVREDIPTEVALAQKSLGEAIAQGAATKPIAIHQCPHLGAHPSLGSMLASQLAAVDTEAKILLAHGTRRTGGNEPVEAVAKQLGAVAAYWSIKPTLEEQIVTLADTGHQQIAIVPYFLFCGGITDAIAKSVTSLQARFPKLELSLANPIGVSPQLANLIVELTQDEPILKDADQLG
jgi:sirohydrochlorin ferrochelatase